MRLTALAVVLLASLACTPLRSETRAASNPVVVELFTSQGCSSCPPADGLLTRLAAEAPANVILLSFHVDYWNYIGWTDPYSSHAWSQRQSDYARKFGDNPYTPQVVVNGTTYAVGSDESRVRSLIAKAAATPAAGTIALRRAAISGNDVMIDVDASSERAGSTLIAVLYETDLVIAVKNGENGGKSLRNDFVVRRFQEVAAVSSKPSHQTATLPIDPAWSRAHLGVALFLQDRDTRAIHAGVMRRL